jgi:hypothetical protein
MTCVGHFFRQLSKRKNVQRAFGVPVEGGKSKDLFNEMCYDSEAFGGFVLATGDRPNTSSETSKAVDLHLI